MAKLMYGNHPCQYHIVAYCNMAPKGTIVRENTMVTHKTIVGNMTIRLDQTITANHSFPLVLSAAVDRNTFPDRGVIANFSCRNFPIKFQVLWNSRNHCPRKYTAIFAYTRSIHDGHIRPNPCSLTDHNVLVDGHKRFYNHIICDFRLWMDIC